MAAAPKAFKTVQGDGVTRRFVDRMDWSSRRLFALTALLVGILISSHASATYRVTQGQASRQKSLTIAGPQGAELTYPSGVVMRLDPGTRVRQHKPTKLWLEGAGAAPARMVTLLSGRLDVHVPPPSKGRKQWAALVRSELGLLGGCTQGSMSAYAGAEAVAVSAESGRVAVSDGGKFEPLANGRIASMKQKKGEISQRALVPPPNLNGNRRVWIALSGPASVGGFTWGPVTGAKRYVLSVTRQGETLSRQELAKPQAATHIAALEPGVYALQVRSIDEFGFVGPASEALQFNVVGVVEEEGSRVEKSGKIRVGIKRRATFSHVDGLLMTYGSAKRWARATLTVPLYRPEPTTVHFKHPLAEHTVSATLVPRGVSADVYLGPKDASWPGDPVNVIVSVHDASGTLDLAELDLKLTVHVGIRPLELEWNVEGNVLTAQIPAQKGDGPWILRAAAFDRYGVELGRDFVEVSRRPTKKVPAAKPGKRSKSVSIGMQR